MPPSDLLDRFLAFGESLRAAGLDVHLGRLIDAVEALGHIDLASRSEVHHALRTLLIHRHTDFPTFDRVFDEFWSVASRRPRRSDTASPAAGADAAVVTGTLMIKTWSRAEALADKDFSALSPAELAAAQSALANLTWTAGMRKTRRWAAGRGARIDLRRALARSLRARGELLDLPRKRRRLTPRPIVLICDVSGSMERYSRTLLHFAHGLAKKARRVEAFLFATRLTRITMALREPQADAAIGAAARTVRDWSGGTRIGAALRAFHQQWSRRALSGGPVVLLISDGWDRGEPQLLREEVARLQRSCHRLIWLNPLIGTADFAPLTQGLQAALPFVDDFLPVRTLRDVADLASQLARLRHGGRNERSGSAWREQHSLGRA